MFLDNPAYKVGYGAFSTLINIKIMEINFIDWTVLIGYFVILLGVGFWTGRGKRDTAGDYFLSKGTLPWWAIGAAYVATGMNTEQLIGQNGMGYQSGAVIINWYLLVPIVYGSLIFFFYPVYLRNGIKTMPEYLGRRFNGISKDIFAVFLIVSYVLMNLAVVFYGGAVLLQKVMGGNLVTWLLVLAIVSGISTMYGGESSMVYGAFFQFLLIFIAGAALFILAYLQLPNGWSDVVKHAPGGFHLIQPMNHPDIPWHAILLTVFGLHLYYSCINQSLVQRGFGAKTEWDARMAIVFAGAFVLFRPFVEIIPGMMARAIHLSGGPMASVFDFGLFGPDPKSFNPDFVFPTMIHALVPAGLKGLLIVGIMAGIMSTISALLNSISTLFTFEIYKRWIKKDASDKQLVKVGTIATLGLMIFSIAYAPQIQKFGGIFKYFQTASGYFAIPIAVVFIMGMFWKRATAIACTTILIIGIPFGWLMHATILPAIVPEATYIQFNLANNFVVSGITQIVLMILMVIISLVTPARPEEEIKPLLWSLDKFSLPKDEPQRPLIQSVGLWFIVLTIAYGAVYYMWW